MAIFKDKNKAATEVTALYLIASGLYPRSSRG